MDGGQQSHLLKGGAEEWLRRIARGQSMATIPESVAVALVDLGVAQKTDAGRFEATDAGKAHLDAQGIAYIPVYRKRR